MHERDIDPTKVYISIKNNKSFWRRIEHQERSFSMEELKAAKKRIKSGKACGLDNIPAEVWLTGDFNNELLDFYNKITNRIRSIDA